MLYGLRINGIDTMEHYGLVLLSDLKVSAPELKEAYTDIPGSDGSLNMSFALTGCPTYKDRNIIGTLFKRADDFSFTPIMAAISNDYHGTVVNLQLPSDLDHFYKGVIQFGVMAGYNSCRIPFSAHVHPWRYKNEITTVTRDDLTTNYKTLNLNNERRSVVPSITVTAETTLLWGTSTYTIGTGTHLVPDICLKQGSNTLKAKLTTATSGSITVTYQEASL